MTRDAQPTPAIADAMTNPNSELPDCAYRTPTWLEGIHFCRHTSVHATDHLVNDDVCNTCGYCETPCSNPHDVPPRLGLIHHALSHKGHRPRIRPLARYDGDTLVTIGITAFKRPKSLEKLVSSIRQFYPKTPIIIGDNGDEYAHVPKENLTYRKLPFDCGLSAARNAIIDDAQTPFLLILEDDFQFTAETRIEKFLDVLMSDQTVGAVGGSLKQDGILLDFAVDFDVFRGQLSASRTTRPWKTARSGSRYRYADKVFNFLMLRREMLLEHRWDPDLKLSEHTDFFLQIKSALRWRVAFCPEVVCDHNQKREGEYREYRLGQRVQTHARLFKEKHRLQTASVPPARLVPRTPEAKPNLVLFGVGHSGTSVITQMLVQLGWHGEGRAGDLDREFFEHVPIRNTNSELLQDKKWSVHAACHELLQLPEPWIIKDPRFVHTLKNWIPAFSAWEPCLLWLTRDLESVKDSYRRRQRDPTKEPMSRGYRIADLVRRAAKLYEEWPWAKHRIRYEDVRDAVDIFDPHRGNHNSTTAFPDC